MGLRFLPCGAAIPGSGAVIPIRGAVLPKLLIQVPWKPESEQNRHPTSALEPFAPMNSRGVVGLHFQRAPCDINGLALSPGSAYLFPAMDNGAGSTEKIKTLQLLRQAQVPLVGAGHACSGSDAP